MRTGSFFQDLFLTRRFFLVGGMLGLLFIFTSFSPRLMPFATALLLFLVLLFVIDYGLLFWGTARVVGEREIPERLSLGEEQAVRVKVHSSFRFPLKSRLIDELPFQFQERHFGLQGELPAGGQHEFSYLLRPVERGEYLFGNLRLFVSGRLGFVERQFNVAAEEIVKVYPSFLHLKKYQIKSLPDARARSGGRITYRKGISTEFDHIREYSRGDDVRTINWKASARSNQMMVNSFMDEKSQQIYCLIDKGRLMKMPFDGLTLLDYAINATLMFSYVALQKDDRVGIMTFAERMSDVLQASRSRNHFREIMETLYRQETSFPESNFEALFARVTKGIGQRSLLILFTHFETYSGFARQAAYFKALSRKHLLLVVLFENTELSKIHQTRQDGLEDIYIKTIADQFTHEKKLIVRELRQAGLLVVECSPRQLTVQLVNTYLELKARNFL